MTKTAAEVYRDYQTDGVPGSGPNSPAKSEIRALLGFYETLFNSSAAGLAYLTRAALFADLTPAANLIAIVYSDATPAYNGSYVKSGATGIGSWTRIGDLPNGIVRLTVTGGSANAIVAAAAETPIIPGNKLYLMTPTLQNTSTTTVSVNGATAVEIKNSTGLSLASGSLLAGSQVLMAWATDHYQLLISANTDADAALASVLAAVSDADTARDAAIAAAGTNIVNFEKISAARAYTVPSVIKYFRTAGRAAAGDGGETLYTKLSSTPSPVQPWHEQTADGAYWILCPLPVLRPEMFDNGIPGLSTDCGPALRNCRDYINALGAGVLELNVGTYSVSTLRSERIFEPSSNMTVRGKGAGSVIRVANGVVSGSGILAICTQTFETDRADNFRCCDFAIDMNGANNLTSTYSAGIALGVGNDPIIENVTLLNHPGSQGIALGVNAGLSGEPSAPTVLRPKILRCTTLNLGNTVNSGITDSSAIYVVGLDCEISGNIITNDTQDTFGTGVEMHGSGTTTGNVFDKVAKLYNVGAFPESSWTISGNKATDCLTYASVWNWLGSGTAFQTSVVFANDHVKTGQAPGTAPAGFIDLSSAITDTAFVSSIHVRDCHFECTLAAGNSNSVPFVSIGQAHLLDISGNTITGFPGQVMTINATTGINPGQTTVRFSENDVLNCCTTSTSGHTIAVQLDSGSALAAFIASDNLFYNDGGTYMTKCFQGTAIPAGYAVANNVKVGVATMGP